MGPGKVHGGAGGDGVKRWAMCCCARVARDGEFAATAVSGPKPGFHTSMVESQQENSMKRKPT